MTRSRGEQPPAQQRGGGVGDPGNGASGGEHSEQTERCRRGFHGISWDFMGLMRFNRIEWGYLGSILRQTKLAMDRN